MKLWEKKELAQQLRHEGLSLKPNMLEFPIVNKAV
jgi:hypothetical protein